MKSPTALLLAVAVSTSALVSGLPQQQRTNSELAVRAPAAPIAEASAPIMKKPGGLMAAKMASRERCRTKGLCGKFSKDSKRAVRATCINGRAGEYPCKGVDMLDQLSHPELGSAANAEGNDCWGWTSADGRQFGMVGQTDGTAFVEIDRGTGDMTYIGRLPTQTVNSIWRDIKVKGNYAYISAESEGHGLQIFDLRKLLATGLAARPKVFSTLTDVTVFRGFGSAHNVVEGPAGKNYMVAVGQVPCNGGPYFVDVSTPTAPKNLGCYSADGYTHDAQIVIYKGPDARFTGREILFGYNEDTLTILDVTNKSNMTLISRTPYTGSAYTHQGWLVDDGMTYLLSDDELDELDRTSTAADGRTATYLWNIKDLTKPVQEGVYKSPVTSIDHNQYVHNGRSYQANYASGLRIVDVSKVASGGGVASMSEWGFFDVYPEGDPVEFYGSWNAYRFPATGHILVNSIERGAFLLKEQA